MVMRFYPMVRKTIWKFNELWTVSTVAVEYFLLPRTNFILTGWEGNIGKYKPEDCNTNLAERIGRRDS